MGHRPGPALLHRQAGLGAVERPCSGQGQALDLRFLVNRQHQTVGGWVEIEADHVAQFGGKSRVLRQLESGAPDAAADRAPPRSAAPSAPRCRWPPPSPDQSSASPPPAAPPVSVRRHDRTAPTAKAAARAFWSCRAAGREQPSRMNRSCQRHTQGFETPARRMTSTVPQSSAVARMIRARQTCFCGLLRSAATAASRSRSPELTSILTPSRIVHYRIRRPILVSYDCVGPLASGETDRYSTAQQ